MKKIILAAFVVLGLASCDNGLFDGEVSFIKKITLTNVLANQTYYFVGGEASLKNTDGSNYFKGDWGFSGWDTSANPNSITTNASGVGVLDISSTPVSVSPTAAFKFAASGWGVELGPDAGGGGNFDTSNISGYSNAAKTFFDITITGQGLTTPLKQQGTATAVVSP